MTIHATAGGAGIAAGRAPLIIPHLGDPVNQTDPTAALRDRLIAAIKASPFEGLRAVDHSPNGPLQITVKVDDLADTLLRLAVLPEPTGRAAVLREAADIAESQRRFERVTAARWSAQVSENVGILRVADHLRRLAVEADGNRGACGRTKSVCGTEYPPCGRPAGHEEAYCRSADGNAYFLAVGHRQPAAEIPPHTMLGAAEIEERPDLNVPRLHFADEQQPAAADSEETRP